MFSWFRKKKKKQTSSNPVEQLAEILREYGGLILEGNGKLCLTTPILITLNRDFQNLTFRRDSLRHGDAAFDVIKQEGPNEDTPFIFDFVQKSPNLKLVSGPVCIPSPQLSLLAFKSLTLLEIQKVPILHVHGLHHIAKHIKRLICHRSTHSIKEAVYQFGKDFNGVLTLPELETLDLSYNTITCLDDSLKLLPSLENLNLCYNCLGSADSDSIPPVHYLNLGFNSITKVPSYPLLPCYSIKTLILCNNSLTSLEGMEQFQNLEFLDVSSNCLVRFDDVLPLSNLQFLVSLHMQGNPVQFMADYRLEMLSRLSPLLGRKTMTFDGQELNGKELMNLGMKVLRPALLPYDKDRLIDKRSSKSMIDLPVSTRGFAGREPLNSSTPNGTRFKGSTQKRRSAKVRNAFIFDRSSQDDPVEAETEKEASLISTNVDTVSSVVRQSSFSSRRSSIDDAIVWIHRNVSGDVLKVSRSLPDIDYATQLDEEELNDALEKMKSTSEQDELGEATDSVYDLNGHDSLSTSSGSSISVVIEDDDVSVFLLESVIGGDQTSMEEKESLFVFFKHPYLIEKDPITGKVIKLDLNYLQEVTPFPNGTLRVSLRFDLVRYDRRKRLYLFEDLDHAEEFNEFVGHLLPIARRNREVKEALLENYFCLKCSTVFQKQRQETSFALCPSCSSSMVVEQTPGYVASHEEPNDGPSGQEVSSGPEVRSSESPMPVQCAQSGKDPEQQSEPSTVQRDPSFEVLAHFGDPHYQHLTSATNTVAPFKQEGQLSLPLVDDTQSLGGTENEQNGPMVINNARESDEEDSSNTETTNELFVTANDGTPESNQPILKQINGLKTSLKSKLSGSSLSIASSNGIASAEESQCATPTLSQGSGRTSRPLSVATIQGSANNFIVVNDDDLTKCDHRLKLYFSMDLFHMEEEEFRCMIKCPYVKYDRANVDDCLLMVSTANVYLFKLRCPESDSPKSWLQVLIKYRFTELKYIDCCYFNQSFRLEFNRDFGSYKFLVGDSQRCQSFVSLLLRAVEDAVSDKQSLSIVSNDPNPRTETNIRSQIFGLEEDPILLAKRLFEQATMFTIPSLLTSKKVRMRTHQCVSGKDLVTWMVSRREAKSRKDAISLCQKLVDIGFIYHISRELQFQDTDDLYKFDFSDNPKKMSSNTLQKAGRLESVNSESDIEEMDMNTDVCLYLQGQARLRDDDEAAFERRSIIITKSHFFLAVESHQWPLSRIYQPPSFLKEQFKLIARHRIIDLVKITLFEDSPHYLMLEFIDELGDMDSRESSWLFLVETIREVDALRNQLQVLWEEEMKVELVSEVFPSINLFV